MNLYFMKKLPKNKAAKGFPRRFSQAICKKVCWLKET